MRPLLKFLGITGRHGHEYAPIIPSQPSGSHPVPQGYDYLKTTILQEYYFDYGKVNCFYGGVCGGYEQGG